MTTQTLPDIAELKAQAKRLRAALVDDGDFITHSESLELLAKQYGFRDWNTLHARAGNRPSEPYRVGDQRSGAYLGQSFTGEIVSVKRLANGALYQPQIKVRKVSVNSKYITRKRGRESPET